MEATPRASPASLVGRVIDTRFELFEYIGSGSLMHVFRAWDQRVQHIVAVKILDTRYASDASAVTAFEEGARRAAGLPQQPVIVPVHEVGRDGAVPYIVTEFVSGKTLRQVIASEAPLEVDRAFRICRQVARALDFAHQYGVDHQNIQPANIMLLPRDDVKVTDFGLVVPSADLAGTQILTPDSPDLTSSQAPGANSDVYSLGMVLWEMLTGSPPFTTGNAVIRATMQRNHRLPDLRQINPSVSPAAASIVLRALSLNGERKYDNAGALADALQQYLMNEKGDTSTEFVPGPIVQDTENTVQSPLSNGSKPVAPQTAQPKTPARPAFAGPPTSRWRPSWATLVFLLVIGLAVAGGWFAYQAIWHALNGSSSGSHAASATRHLKRQGNSVRAQQRGRHTVSSRRAPVHAAALNPNLAGSPACANQGARIIHLPTIWAEETHPLPGQGVQFDYTITNDGSQCQNVRLGLSVVSPVRPGVFLTDPSHDRVAVVMPGTKMYRRRFRFTRAMAGQTFDTLLTVSDRTGAQVYAQIRVPHLISVAP